MKLLRVSRFALYCCLLFVQLLFCYSAFSLEKPGENLKDVGLTTENGAQLDLSLKFTGTDGESKPLSAYSSSEKPTILIPAYYDCPRLCGLLLNGVSDLLKKLQLSLGEDYRAVTVSFNPGDTAQSAAETAKKFRSGLPEGVGNASEWVFLSGEDANIVPLMKQLGFHYKEDRGEFAHTAAIFILTPEGKISQHFAGISFPYRDVRLAMVEASEGKIGTLLDQALLFCFRFDPSQGKYTWAAFNVVRAGGGATLVFLVALIFWLRRREKDSLPKP